MANPYARIETNRMPDQSRALLRRLQACDPSTSCHLRVQFRWPHPYTGRSVTDTHGVYYDDTLTGTLLSDIAEAFLHMLVWEDVDLEEVKATITRRVKDGPDERFRFAWHSDGFRMLHTNPKRADAAL